MNKKKWEKTTNNKKEMGLSKSVNRKRICVVLTVVVDRNFIFSMCDVGSFSVVIFVENVK